MHHHHFRGNCPIIRKVPREIVKVARNEVFRVLLKFVYLTMNFSRSNRGRPERRACQFDGCPIVCVYDGITADINIRHIILRHGASVMV